jgi:hypothetical protein
MSYGCNSGHTEHYGCSDRGAKTAPREQEGDDSSKGQQYGTESNTD